MEQFTVGGVLEVLAFSGALITAYVRLQMKIKEIEMNILAINEKLKSVEKQDDKIMEKLDKIFGEINEIKLQMQLKVDKE